MAEIVPCSASSDRSGCRSLRVQELISKWALQAILRLTHVEISSAVDTCQSHAPHEIRFSESTNLRLIAGSGLFEEETRNMRLTLPRASLATSSLGS